MTDKEKAKIRAEIIMSLKEGYKPKVTMTAVEYLIDWMGKNQYFIGNDLLQLVEQAKEMEKQQIMNAWLVDGYTDISDDNWKSEFNEYYNETYKNTEI